MRVPSNCIHTVVKTVKQKILGLGLVRPLCYLSLAHDSTSQSVSTHKVSALRVTSLSV